MCWIDSAMDEIYARRFALSGSGGSQELGTLNGLGCVSVVSLK